MKEPASEGSESNIATPETTINDVETLPYRLGFEETPNLVYLRGRIVVAVREGDIDDLQRALNGYINIAEVLATETGNAAPQVGLIIAQALIWREASEPKKYLRAISDALEYADNMGFDDAVTILRRELDAGSNGES